MAPTTDHEARAKALDTARSFIVQAPAGSGKTELLIQRYLALLGIVKEPEQVVAITFTRKAAAEMRARVLDALRTAEENASTVPHRVRTMELARAVMRRDEIYGWGIRANTQRLRIQTLDSLNAALASQLALLSGGLAGTRLLEDATAEYVTAARRTVDYLSGSKEGATHIRRVLREQDYDLSRLERRIAELLSRRDRWLHVLAEDPGRIDEANESTRRAILSSAAARLSAAFPDNLLDRVLALLEHAAQQARSTPLREKVSAWIRQAEEGERVSEDARLWQAIAGLLLTERGEWRKRLATLEGFGKKHAAMRDELRGVLSWLERREDLRRALNTVSQLPTRRGTSEERALMRAMRVVLLHAAAELRVCFASRQAIDFTELSLAALQALGTFDRPSELLLALDHRIQHILVDEYQDTSLTQIRLLELLTAGWEPHDGRTLFLVGDPMQSIYRFRNADMSLFLRTRRHGIGPVRCEPISLSMNFRSAPAIVSWVNEVFANVFPEHDDTEVGATKFHPCMPFRQAQESHFVHCHPLLTTELEAELDKVVELITRERELDPSSSIGILVQSRTHLVGLRAKLRRLPWSVRAVEIDAPHAEQFVQDLLCLCRGMMHLADRVAWLAILRAPWCGLSWNDLERLIDGDESSTIWELMHDETRLQRVDWRARQRLIRVRDVLQAAFERREGESFSHWIERTWTALHGPATLASDVDRAKMDDFFGRLDTIVSEGIFDDPALLELPFKRPSRESDQPGASSIDIMTIHRAKGLEFDTVILTGLNRVPRSDSMPALHVLQRVDEHGKVQVMVAPETLAPGEMGLFIKRMESERDLAERIRLLYVATTRARERLHLVWGQTGGTPAARSLIAGIWRHIEDSVPARAPHDERLPADSGQATVLEGCFNRLSDAYLARLEQGEGTVEKSGPGRDVVEYEWASESAVEVGKVVHRYLQIMADTDLDAWTAQRIRGSTDEYRRNLELLGVEPRELDTAVRRVVTALERVLDDARGHWILKARESAQSEYRLTIRNGTELSRIRIDRTFVDEHDMRWIIDYKTGSHEGGDLDAFLDSEVVRYRPQLERYARAMAEIDTRELRVALYYPLLQAFRHWRPAIGRDAR